MSCLGMNWIPLTCFSRLDWNVQNFHTNYILYTNNRMPFCMQVNWLNNVLIFLTNQDFFFFMYLCKSMWLFFWLSSFVSWVMLFCLVGFIIVKYRITQLARVFSNASNSWLKTIQIYDYSFRQFLFQKLFSYKNSSLFSN